MTTNVLLVRHGQTDSNINGFYMGWSNEDLNQAGYTQARCLSSRLADLPVATFYTSPLRRACTTATILAEPHHLEPNTSDDLTEIRLGDWQGLHMDEIRQKWPELWRQWRADPSQLTLPNGESLNEVAERSLRAFEGVVRDNEGKYAVIVTHDVVVKLLVAHVLGAPNSIYRRFNIGNTSLTVVRVINDTPRLTLLNDTSHLES